MKALVYHGPGSKAWEDVPDAAVRTRPTSWSGSTPPRSAAPTCTSSTATSRRSPTAASSATRRSARSTAVGAAVTGFAVGDRVLVPAITPLRAVRVLPARHALALPDRRRHRLDLRPPDRRHPGRGRARAVRRHLAVPRPRGVTDEQAIFLADSLPTGYEVGVLAGGCAPATRSRSWAPARRPRGDAHHRAVGRVAGHRGRLQQVPARQGARVRRRPTRSRPAGRGRGVLAPDRRARRRRRDRGRRLPGDAADRRGAGPPGRHVANIGVHGVPVELPMQELWIQNVTLTMGLVDTVVDPDPADDGRRAAASRPRRWARTVHLRPDRARRTRCSATPPPTQALKVVITTG